MICKGKLLFNSFNGKNIFSFEVKEFSTFSPVWNFTPKTSALDPSYNYKIGYNITCPDPSPKRDVLFSWSSLVYLLLTGRNMPLMRCSYYLETLIMFENRSKVFTFWGYILTMILPEEHWRRQRLAQQGFQRAPTLARRRRLFWIFREIL